VNRLKVMDKAWIRKVMQLSKIWTQSKIQTLLSLINMPSWFGKLLDCQINLASIYFWQNRKNYAPTVWHLTWQILTTWQIFPLHAHICALSASAHPASRAGLFIS
jgi:hypothetical protein